MTEAENPVIYHTATTAKPIQEGSYADCNR